MIRNIFRSRDYIEFFKGYLFANANSHQAAAANAYVSTPVQPLSSVLCLAFLKDIFRIIDEEVGWLKFNESMHSRYGYKGSDKFPLISVTKTDYFKILEDFHNQLDERCKWMAKVWIDLLEPLV